MRPGPALARFVLPAFLLAPILAAETLEGRVVDARGPLAGVRVHPDRPRRIDPAPVPEAWTDTEGRFRLDLADSDQVLAVEKDGWVRDLVPRTEWGGPIRMAPAPAFRREPVLVVRVDVPGVPAGRSDAEVRTFLFSDRPGQASAASYLTEVSKGLLKLEEGRMLHVAFEAQGAAPTEAMKPAIARRVLEALAGLDLRPFDQVDNRTGRAVPDGKPDHLWVLVPGPPGSVTAQPNHLKSGCLLMPMRGTRWPVVVLTEEAPLGNLVHEALHAMGEHRVDDLYKGCDDPATAGIWDLMDAGQYRGWEAPVAAAGPWREAIGTSPSPPGPWVRTTLWYRGAFAPTVRTLRMRGRVWTGWIAPIARAPGADPQRIIVPDPRRRGTFWELWVAVPWGFEAGRVGGRWGPGHAGLLVARVDPGRLDRPDGAGPVRILDAHPGTPEPPPPRLPCGRHQLDDAAFNLGPGEQPAGRDGALHWRVLARDAAGRLKLKLERIASGVRR